jgi:hypothetical protein
MEFFICKNIFIFISLNFSKQNSKIFRENNDEISKLRNFANELDPHSKAGSGSR